jgi:multiple sugar transport system substrate-binding protein
MRRRDFLKVSSTALGGAVMAALGSGAVLGATRRTGVAAGTAPATTEPVDLTWFTVIEQYHAAWTGRNQAIEMFRQDHPNVTITPEIVPFDQWHTQTLTRALAGEAPSFAEQGQLTAELVAADTLVATDDYIARDGIDKADYYTPLWQIVEFAGKTWGLPTSIDTRFTFYNQALLESIGADGPPATWDDLKALAEPAKAAGVHAIGLYFNPEIVGMFNQGSSFMFTNNAVSAVVNEDGTASATVNSPEMIETVEFFQALVQSEAVPPSGPTDGYEVVDTQFINGETILLPSGNWNVPRFDKENADGNMAFLPQLAPIPKNAVDASTAGGISWYIFKTNPDPDVTWEFLNFLDRDDIVDLGVNSAYPGKKAALKVPYYAADPRNEFIGTILEVSRWPVPPVAGWLDLLPAVWRNVMLAISGQASAADAMATGNTEVQALLDAGHNQLVVGMGG